MNKYDEEIKQILTSVIDAKEFVLSELPDYIQQLLMWKMWESLADVALSLIVLSIGVVALVKYFSSETFKNADDDDKFIFRIMVFIASIVPASMVIAFFNLIWLQILVAPKVFLLKHFSHLITG